MSGGNLSAIRVSTTGTYLLRALIEAALGKSPSVSMMRTRFNHIEVVFLCLKANCANFSTKSSVSLQFMSTRIFSEGEEDGSENMVEKKCNRWFLTLKTRMLRVGKSDGRNAGGWELSKPKLRYRKRNCRTSLRGSNESS